MSAPSMAEPVAAYVPIFKQQQQQQQQPLEAGSAVHRCYAGHMAKEPLGSVTETALRSRFIAADAITDSRQRALALHPALARLSIQQKVRLLEYCRSHLSQPAILLTRMNVLPRLKDRGLRLRLHYSYIQPRIFALAAAAVAHSAKSYYAAASSAQAAAENTSASRVTLPLPQPDAFGVPSGRLQALMQLRGNLAAVFPASAAPSDVMAAVRGFIRGTGALGLCARGPEERERQLSKRLLAGESQDPVVVTPPQEIIGAIINRRLLTTEELAQYVQLPPAAVLDGGLAGLLSTVAGGQLTGLLSRPSQALMLALQGRVEQLTEKASPESSSAA